MKALCRIATVAALGFAALMAKGQEPGTVVTYTIPAPVAATANRPAEWYTCGAMSTGAMNCDRIPLSDSTGKHIGTMWLFASFNSYTGKPYVWALFEDPYPYEGVHNPLGGNLDIGSNFGFNPKAIAPHAGFPYAGPPFVCNNNCSTFEAVIPGLTASGVHFTANVTIDWWDYRACGGRTCITDGIANGGEVVVQY